MDKDVLNMTEEEIEAEIDEIGKLADYRFHDLCDNAPALAGLTSRIQLLTDPERDRMHILKLALTEQYGYLHTPEAAHNRIIEKIEQRKTGRR